VYNRSIGLYIHIPFCKSKCHYCDFNSFAGKDELALPYFEAMKKEIRQYSDKLKDCSIKTVFIGGGTPSYVEACHIYEVVNIINQSFNIEYGAEVSIEANPGTLSFEKLMSYRVMGINRLSMGLQACQNRLLKEIGRIHSMEEFEENYNQARKAGFKNINVDLIFGLPTQSIKDWNDSISSVVKLCPEHVSCYSLKIEDDTAFGRSLAEGGLTPLDDEVDREMYYSAITELEKHGLKHYEISNFATPWRECRHNLIYWRGEQYLGVGAGAHSYLDDKRFNNACDINSYISQIGKSGSAIEDTQLISKKDEISEYLILGLRLIKGISADEFMSRFNEDLFELYGNQINKLIKKHLLELDNGRLRLSCSGLDLANQVFVEFI